MLQAHFTSDIQQVLNLLNTSLDRSKNKYRLCGIVFAHPNNEFAKSNIISMVDYWNCRSKEYADFFFLGYLEMEMKNDVQSKTSASKNHFNNQAFVDAIEYIESKSGWVYKGNPCMLLCRGSLNDTGGAQLDLNSLIEIDFMQAQKDGLINSVDSFFESIIRVSKNKEFAGVNFNFIKMVYGKSLANSMIKTILDNLPIDVSRIFNTASSIKIINSE